MIARADLLTRALREPSTMATLAPREAGLLVAQARAAGLLARLAAMPASASLPAPAQPHLASARRVAAAQRDEVRREVAYVRAALLPLGMPVVLLKGAAYAMAGLPPAQGRVFSDIDLMVPKTALANAESLLGVAGWAGGADNAYDERYYREWMHELPPMVHRDRGTTIDLHHAILPPTARLRPDPEQLFANRRPLPGQPGLCVLAPEDMVLHAMTHLVMNEEFSHALRDLSDIDLLLRHFAHEAGWWPRLLDRAGELGLRRPLSHALRQAHRLLSTPVPDDCLATCERWAPPQPLRAILDAAWRRAFAPDHAPSRLSGHHLALALLYVRGHWLRMPPLLLARHLSIKALGLHRRQPRQHPAT